LPAVKRNGAHDGAPSDPVDRLPSQVRRAYDLSLRQYAEAGGAEGEGVLPVVWRNACSEAGIPDSTIRYSTHQLRDVFHLVRQTGADGAYSPAAESPESGDGTIDNTDDDNQLDI
jgi:hypothetical protein